MKNDIVLMATYWNEIEWIHASLAQIDALNPKEIIICDGCFDPNKPNYSTDGTREVIVDYVKSKDNARLISALRLSRLQHALAWLKKMPHETGYNLEAKLRLLRSFRKTDLYRLNQSATFNYMIKISKGFSPNSWFMSYDCDQFYNDDMIKTLPQILKKNNFNIITGKEYTFFNDFNSYSDSYETRDYNNMPHRIFEDLRFIPTRHPARIINGRYKVCSYFEENKKYAGIIFHYHVKSEGRLNAGYSLGNRKPPDERRVQTKPFNGQHPSLINKDFDHRFNVPKGEISQGE